MPEYNSALADEIIGVIRTNPQRHHNGWWVQGDYLFRRKPSAIREDCGTTACVAGWAAILTVPDDWMLGDRSVLAPDLACYDYDVLGREALGLTCSQADWLFSALRTQDEVLWALKWLADHPDADARDLSGSYRPEPLLSRCRR